MSKYRNVTSPQAEDALKDERKGAIQAFACDICGRPAERKHRRNGTWYYYDRCRGCRRQSADAKPAPVGITDGQLLYLLQLLYHHLWRLKVQSWADAPRKAVLERLKIISSLVKEG